MKLIFSLVLLIYVAENYVFCRSNTDYESNNNKFDTKGDLLLVQLIFRHGDRTPLQFYKNDPWKDEKFWEDERGQLTNVGKQQAFDLGQYIRNRYSTFLNESYSEQDVYIQSSDVDRTIMSAEAFLAALYRPTTSTDIWNTHLPWQPIPVHTTTVENDDLIHSGRSCAAFSQRYDELMDSKEIKEFDSKHKNLYDYLSLHSGDNIQKMSDVVPIRDTLQIETIYNRTLPEWVKRIFPKGDLYNSIEEAALQAFKLDTSTPFLAKIKGGFLLKDILDRFTNKSRSILDPDRKLWVYSGHDTTIIRVLNSLGLLESIPTYTTCIMFEMRNITGVPHVEIFLKNLTTVVPLHIPNCGLSCPLVNLYELYKDVLPTKSFEEECYVKNSRYSGTNKNASNFILNAAILLVLLTKRLW